MPPDSSLGSKLEVHDRLACCCHACQKAVQRLVSAVTFCKWDLIEVAGGWASQVLAYTIL